MEVKDRFNGLQRREIDYSNCELRVLDEQQRMVELSFSSETPVKRWGVFEVLSHKSGAVLLDRINSTGCLLFNHDRDKVIGKVVEAKVKNKRGTAVVQFDDDDGSTVYFNKVKNGTLRGVSVGYVVHEMERSVKGKDADAREYYTATSWEPLEISIVSVPADISVGVGRSMPEVHGYTSRLVDYQVKINQNNLKARRRNKGE